MEVSLSEKNPKELKMTRSECVNLKVELPGQLIGKETGERRYKKLLNECQKEFSRRLSGAKIKKTH